MNFPIIILAGGKGTRIKKLTKQTPKALIKIYNKYLKNIPVNSRANDKTSYLDKSLITKWNIKIISELNKLALRRGQTLSQMAIAWTLYNETITSSLVGVKNLSQLKENLKSLDNLYFSKDEIKNINKNAKDGNINIWKQSSSY